MLALYGPCWQRAFSVTTIRTVLVSIFSFSIDMFLKCVYWVLPKVGIYSEKALVARLFFIILKTTFMHDIAL